jgi:hypothetical protein
VAIFSSLRLGNSAVQILLHAADARKGVPTEARNDKIGKGTPQKNLLPVFRRIAFVVTLGEALRPELTKKAKRASRMSDIIGTN